MTNNVSLYTYCRAQLRRQIKRGYKNEAAIKQALKMRAIAFT
jgi:hypothetical protein